MGNSPPLSRSRFGRNKEVLSDSFEAASRLGDGDTRESFGTSFEELDAGMLPAASERNVQPPLGQVAVKMQYSHKLGTVSEAYLNTLLQNLSEGKSEYQWTLSAPIQSPPPDDVSSSEQPQPVSIGSQTEGANCFFCSTYPIANTALTGWPYGVTEQTNTVLLELWLSLPDMTEDVISRIEGYVRGVVGTWLCETVKVSEHVWIMSRFITPVNNGYMETVKGFGSEDTIMIKNDSF